MLAQVLGNQKGQMAIFVALIFQVLFVFFAMIINVGLLVHDKINLQNSVDLAAIYAAQRQAEILNSIAHTNYQIRQDWKLLSWRMRVLGDSGRKSHPINNPLVQLQDVGDPFLENSEPSVCVSHSLWSDARSKNVCKQKNLNIPKIPSTKPIAVFLPFNWVVHLFTEQMRTNFSEDCNAIGPNNWSMAARWFVAYKMDLAHRRKVIDRLAENLTVSKDHFLDIQGREVMEGVAKTLSGNLTEANKQGLDTSKVRLFNSMGEIPRQVWLPEIAVSPIIPFTDFEGPGDSNCKGSAGYINAPGVKNVPAVFSDENIAKKYDPGSFLRNNLPEPGDIRDAVHSAIGLEKNPWFMAYVGIEVETKPRHPFAPFGEGITLKARAFAKPFGGRIGPWYAKSWPVTSETSEGEKVDRLVPNRTSEKNQTVGGDEGAVPNYSRYPGDNLGLKSVLTLGHMRPSLNGQGITAQVNRRVYNSLGVDLDDPKRADMLAYDETTPDKIPPIRELELAAIAPDLFDITYFSIEPNYLANYIQKATNIFGEGIPQRGDLGWRPEPPVFENVTVLGQMSSREAVISGNRLEVVPFYYLRDRNHMLTGWAPQGPGVYGFPEASFINCDRPIDVNEPVHVPGECAKGGRTGYSVKIVSKDYLYQQDLLLGGINERGGIKNPPPDEF